MIDPKQLDAILAVLRKHGVRGMKCGDLVLELDPAPLPSELVEASEEAQIRWNRPFFHDDPRSDE